MFLLWTAFFVLLLLFFKEPDKPAYMTPQRGTDNG
jgi:hypothetical protein